MMSSLTGRSGRCPRSAAGEHPARLVCLGECRCDLQNSNLIAVILPTLWMSGSVCACACVCVCVRADPTLRTVPQESLKAGNRKQTSSGSSQSP